MSKRFDHEYTKISLRRPLHRELRKIAYSVDMLLEAKGRRISLARVVELLVAHSQLVPMTPEFIENFEFKTRRPGKPTQEEIASDVLGDHPQFKVSEEQLSDKELNKLRDGGGRLVQKQGETQGDWVRRILEDSQWDERAERLWDAWRRRCAEAEDGPSDEGEPLPGDGERRG